MIHTPLARFLAVGGVSAGLNVAARMGFNLVTSYEVAIVLAFPVALTAAFVLNRRYVFQATGSNQKEQYVRFAIVNLIALIQVWLVSVGLANWVFPFVKYTWHSETIAHGIGVLSPVVTSYLAHKHFTFSG
ncbi:GtrA family protein [Rhizobium sp. BK399]|uniref:GtrA family protein n=1 Tax=Rhizobium sp. BK399 TaxID=2587063 RepID=UPI001613850C|nr:GtrA family protein [Rhizobium sp. BK399]MBB3542453.1 putative flippase GtrA [Rhizobium sp. BK399]